MSSSSESSVDGMSHSTPFHNRRRMLLAEVSSSEESSNNGISNSRVNKSSKVTYPTESTGFRSPDDSPPHIRRRKVIKQAEHITVQSCRHCCSICDEEYNRTMRRPLCLPCGHTFCSGCLRAVDNSGSRLCPMCRGDFGVDLVARLHTCFQLIPGNEHLAPIRRQLLYAKSQSLNEGTVWNVKSLNQLQEVERALNNSSVRPKKVAIYVKGDTGVPLSQMKLFLDLLRRTRCNVSLTILDSFLKPSKLHQERDEQLLKELLLEARCQVVEFRGYPSKNIIKHLETLPSLESLGFGLADADDVRATIDAMDKKFKDGVRTIHVSVSKFLALKDISKKISVPPNIRCVAHFFEVNDDDVKVIAKALDAVFTSDSSFELQLHHLLCSLRGTDALLGVMRDFDVRTATVESFGLKPQEKESIDLSCKKFNCKMVWTNQLMPP